MALRTILRYPNPLLERACDPIAYKDNEARLRTLVRDMNETMFAADGAGLAAPQIGELLRVFIIDPIVAGLSESDDPLVFINPTILSFSDERESADEGCLSLPEIFIPVERALTCRVQATALSGDVFEVEGSALFARAMQHENDHLDGRLICDHVGPLKRKMIRRRLARYAD